MPTARLSRHTLWYDTAGQTGSPVVLIMGYCMRGAAWQAQIPALEPHHRVAWFDHAGLGQSGPLATRALRMEHMADDVLDLMDHLRFEDAHVVGISMGGMVAQHVALRARSRVRSLTLVATHPGGGGVKRAALPPLEGLRQFARANFARGDDRIEALCRLLYAEDFLAENRDRARSLLGVDFAAPPPAATRLGQLLAIVRHDTTRRLHELAGLPTLVVQPGCDILIDPRNSETLHRLIPHARLERFDDSGHGVTRQCAERFNALLLEHLAQADARATPPAQRSATSA